MALYELRTYTIYVGKFGEVTELYKTEGWPAFEKYQNKIVGYFTGDIGALNQLLHLWKFEDDADRRRHWAAVYADEAFMAFVQKLRPLVQKQENKLLMAAPWGSHP